MKKQTAIALSPGKKLRLNKRTISNFTAPVHSTHHVIDVAPTKKGTGCFTHKCQPSW